MARHKHYLDIAKRYWTVPSLALIFVLALWLRTRSLRFTHIPDIDVYYMIRQSMHLLANNFHLPSIDVLRYYPTGIDPATELVGTFFIPAMIYAVISKFISLDFITYAKWIPAIFGSFFVLPIYFIGKELRGKITGIAAAFFYTTMPAVMFRTSAGEYEKEAFSILFMLTSIYYIIRAYKHTSLLSGLVAGASLILVGMTWGGVQQLYLAIGGVVGILLLLNKADTRTMYAYLPLVFFGAVGNLLGLTQVGTALTINYLISLLLVVRIAAERYQLVKKEYLAQFSPAIAFVGTAIVLIASFFSATAAGLIQSIQRFIFFTHGVIGSTVAEQAPGNWANFETSLGVGASKYFLNLGGVIDLLDLWILAFAGTLILIYTTQKEKDSFFWLGICAGVVSILSYVSLLRGGSSTVLQLLYVTSIIVATGSVARHNFVAAFILFLIYSSMLSYLSYIRLLIIVGIYLSFAGGYTIEQLAHIIKNKIVSLYGLWWKTEDNTKKAWFGIFCAVIAAVVLAIITTNSLTGYVYANALGPSYNDNWDAAMQFVREETPEESVILSWWDFGYWFQLKGERATNLDGGNNYGVRNIPTAQFFTGMMNESQQKFFLEKMGTTHLLVDASMIGKYSAMSKIANYGRKIDSYIFIPYSQARQTKTGNVLIYSDGRYTVLVPMTANGSISAPKITAGGGEIYVSRLCLPDRVIEFKLPSNVSATDACLMLTQEQAILISREISDSVFHSLFFRDGNGLDYVTKVFDNGEVKIFEIDETKISRQSKEALQTWWNENDYTDLTAVRE